MAFVPLYGLNTAITAATAAGAGQLKVDNNEATAIAAQLGANFTYASLSDGVNYEIVRIDSVTAPFLNVTRGQDGTTTSAFPIGACLRYVWNSEGIIAIAGTGNITLTGAGVVAISGSYPNFTITVPLPTITGTLPIEVLGAWPAWEIGFQGNYGGCCCGGSGGSGGGTITEITASGLASVTGGTGPTANIDVPVFNPIAGANMAITGTWPNITFASTGGGGGGGGGVTSVTGSTKILISGSLANPVVSLITTGVGAGTYNGITYDAWGTITFVNPSYVPITSITSLSPEITVGGSAGNATLTFTPGSGSTVNVLSQSVFDTTGGASYTTTIPGIAITVPILTSTQKAVITAIATVFDSSTPTAAPVWGLGVFDGTGLVNGTTAMPTCTHIVKYMIPGPTGSTQSLFMNTTALSGTMSVITKSITAEIYPT